MNEHIVHHAVRAYRLPLRRPWYFAGHGLRERRGWLIRLDDAAGLTAWGESAPLPPIGTEDFHGCRDWLTQYLPEVLGMDPDSALARLPSSSEAPPAARCGLETALLGLSALQAGQSLAHRLSPEAVDSVEINAALGALQDIAADAIEDWPARGYRCLKVKLAPGDPPAQAEHLRRLCSSLPSGVRLRLDANQAWSFEQARSFMHAVGDLPVEWLEEPLRRADAQRLQELGAAGLVPLALDETLGQGQLDELLKLPGLRALVLKPMRQGGLLPCLAIARRAAAAGLATPVTTSLDGAVAVHACLHLAAAVDGLGRPSAHGLGTSQWLARDLAPSPAIRAARMHLSEPPDPMRGLEWARENEHAVE